MHLRQETSSCPERPPAAGPGQRPATASGRATPELAPDDASAPAIVSTRFATPPSADRGRTSGPRIQARSGRRTAPPRTAQSDARRPTARPNTATPSAVPDQFRKRSLATQPPRAVVPRAQADSASNRYVARPTTTQPALRCRSHADCAQRRQAAADAVSGNPDAHVRRRQRQPQRRRQTRQCLASRRRAQRTPRVAPPVTRAQLTPQRARGSPRSNAPRSHSTVSGCNIRRPIRTFYTEPLACVNCD